MTKPILLDPHITNLAHSRILTIAAQIRALKAEGEAICDLTVGDFAPRQFAIPPALAEAVIAALRNGETNYPPAEGLPVLRQAIAGWYKSSLGWEISPDQVVVASGARPPIYATVASVVAPGETFVYATPSWNNDYYGYLSRAREVRLPTRPEAGFMPTLDDIAPHLPYTRLLHLNSPLNPCGTVVDPDVLRQIALAVVEENQRRERVGARALVLLYDMVYWPLTFGGAQFAHPEVLVPEVAPYTISVDAVSKWMAATGLRVGWLVSPAVVQPSFKALIGHIGAWAPRAEQLAVAQVLQTPDTLLTWLPEMREALLERMQVVVDGVKALQARGLPVRVIAPQGAIYLSIQFDLIGKIGEGGEVFRTNEQIRDFLLRRAGLGLVPFQAFGLEEETGWFRISVGAVGAKELSEGMARLGAALAAII